LGLGGSAGSSGAITCHSLSVSSGFAMPRLYSTLARFC
jgi:hypothetical protein